MPEREPQKRRRRPRGRGHRRRFQEGRLRAAMRRRQMREAGIPESQIRVAPPGPAPGVPDVMPTLPPPEEWHQKTGARVAMVAGGLGLAYLLLRKK